VLRVKTTPVRVKVRTHQLLKRISKHMGRPMADVLDEAVERYRRAELFAAADAAYRHAGTPTDRDRVVWENALADGLPED
jgi:predicted DNA-binding protein